MFTEAYLLRPEPGPVGVNVDPLGEALGASVFPDGFMVLLAPVVLPMLAEPAVLPLGRAVVPPFIEDPVVVPLVAEPADVELPLLCASASVLEIASAPANANVVSFMIGSLVRCRNTTGITGLMFPTSAGLLAEAGRDPHLPQVPDPVEHGEVARVGLGASAAVRYVISPPSAMACDCSRALTSV